MSTTGVVTRLVLIAALLSLAACGTARRGVPLLGPMELSDPMLATGQIHFMRNCNKCHPRGESGVGFALNNKPLNDWMIRVQVRNGFGAMPAFSKDEIADEQLDAIVAYVQYLRERGPFGQE